MTHLDVAGGALYYEVEGNPSAPALVLIHAGIANLRMWDPQLPALAAGHFVVRYDTRGFGQTRTDDVEFSEIDDAVSLLDHLAIQRATIIGCSRGGKIAIDLAIAHPQRVAGLVTVGSGPSGFPDVEPTAEEDALFDQMDVAFEAKDWPTMNDLEVRLWCIGPLRRAEDLDANFVATAHELNRANLAHVDEQPTPVPLEPPAFDRVVDIDVPALVIVGDHDLSEHLAEYEYLSTTLRRADSARFPNSAHVPSVEQPEEFERVLVGWLDQHQL